ncbi:MAG TPA: DUF3592 domain-containing protein [Fibrobacteria bacterium]|nr:DUF3592 domain-containing protein [Fibrobacteria bacterium]
MSVAPTRKGEGVIVVPRHSLAIIRFFTVERILLFMALALLLPGGIWLAVDAAFHAKAVPAIGTFVEYKSGRGQGKKKGSTKYIIRYEHPSGSNHWLVSNVEPDMAEGYTLAEGRTWDGLQKGDRVRLLADWDSGRVIVESWKHWMGPAFLVTAGMVFAAIAILTWGGWRSEA